jgi:hypothetical protein
MTALVLCVKRCTNLNDRSKRAQIYGQHEYQTPPPPPPPDLSAFNGGGGGGGPSWWFSKRGPLITCQFLLTRTPLTPYHLPPTPPPPPSKPPNHSSIPPLHSAATLHYPAYTSHSTHCRPSSHITSIIHPLAIQCPPHHILICPLANQCSRP